MPSELSESSSPDQAGSIQRPFNSRPLCDLLSPIGLAIADSDSAGPCQRMQNHFEKKKKNKNDF